MAVKTGTHRLLTGTRFSVRFRLTLFATLLTAAVIAGTGGALLVAYNYNLIADKKRTIGAGAHALASLAQSDYAPPKLKTAFGYYQLLDPENRVVNGDAVSAKSPPLIVLRAGESERGAVIVNPANRTDHRIYAMAVRAGSNGTAIVADTMDDIPGKVDVALKGALAGGGMFLPIIAALFWMVVGRALRPVERLRTSVAEITKGNDLSQRIAESGGRDEISRLGGTLNEMLQALDEATRAQRRFVADAAHELRTPLAGMTAYLEVAANHPALIDPESLVTRLTAANRHLSDLVNDLLTLAVLDARAPIKHRPVDLAGIVQDGMRHVDPGQIRVEERIAGPCVVTGNPTHLTRVVTNLVSNAIRHARSAVVVQLNNTDTHTVLTVVDDGPGVPQQHRRRIWQRFVRLDDDRNRSSGGSGLGLALVREIVVAHGGAVRVVDAVPGPGAAFGVRLPLREAQ